ncbi:hypothetical protein COLO4_17679 [Corchorus olitorius]|uniref:Uncharacterized protein n=1 Tax=Corchorus olitorius TaxID=93759 RepID=A0A1R3JBV5_9ROSI|nr:hypothetical protein COLO4_17679 [Corchorus olitorius]
MAATGTVASVILSHSDVRFGPRPSGLVWPPKNLSFSTSASPTRKEKS